MTEAEWAECADPAKMLNSVLTTSARAQSFSDRVLRLWVEACREEAGVKHYAYNLTHPDDLVDAVRAWSSESSHLISSEVQAAILRDICGNPWRPVKVLRVGAILRGQQPDGFGGQIESDGYCPWFTPTVLAIARAAHEERAVRKCERCKWREKLREGFDAVQAVINWGKMKKNCRDCKGTGHILSAELDRDRLLILADALEEAGCPVEEVCKHCRGTGRVYDYRTNKLPGDIDCWECDGTGCTPHHIIAHLRGPGPHWRGCRVLTAILGEE